MKPGHPNDGLNFSFLSNAHRYTKHEGKSDPAIQNPCHKEAYPENFINLEQSQAK